MSAVYSELLNRMCDSFSEEWRHECECRWLLKEKPDQIQLNLYLFGVESRSQVVAIDAAGRDRLRPDHARLWKDPKTSPLYAYRGLQPADNLLRDVLKLKPLHTVRREGSLNESSNHEL